MTPKHLSASKRLRWNLMSSEDFTVQMTSEDGREFHYKTWEFTRQIRADFTELDLTRLVDQAISERGKYCQWDREHPCVTAEHALRKGLLFHFQEYLELLKALEADKRL